MNVLINGVEYRPHAKLELMPMSFGDFLRSVRKSVNYTLDTAADKIECSKSYLWEIEHGNGEPSLKMAARISSAYGIPLETLASYLDKS